MHARVLTRVYGVVCAFVCVWMFIHMCVCMETQKGMLGVFLVSFHPNFEIGYFTEPGVYWMGKSIHSRVRDPPDSTSLAPGLQVDTSVSRLL